MAGKALAIQPEQQIENLTSTVEMAYQAILEADKHTPVDAEGNIVPVVVERSIELYTLLDHSVDRHFVYKGAIAEFVTSPKQGRARITLKEFALRTPEGRVAIGQYRKVIRICAKAFFQRAFLKAMGEKDVENIETVTGKDFCLMILDHLPTLTFTHLRAMSDLNKPLDFMAKCLGEWERAGISSSEAEFLVKQENGGPGGGRAYYRGGATVQGIQVINVGKDKIARVTIDLAMDDEEPNDILSAAKEARAAGHPLYVNAVIRATKEKDTK
jgi:hypothetical protein